MMVMTKQIRNNMNIFEAKRAFSACKPTDAVINYKKVDPLLKINDRTSSKLNIAENISQQIFRKDVSKIFDQPNIKYLSKH